MRFVYGFFTLQTQNLYTHKKTAICLHGERKNPTKIKITTKWVFIKAATTKSCIYKKKKPKLFKTVLKLKFQQKRKKINKVIQIEYTTVGSNTERFVADTKRAREEKNMCHDNKM